MLTSKPQTWVMVQPCRTADLVKQNRSIDLATGFLIAILSIAEIVMIAKIKSKKKKICEILLMSLSVSDCMFGLSNVLVSSVFLSQNCQLNLLGKAYAFYFFFVITSIFHLLFIAIDRVMILLIPFRYQSILTKKRRRTCIAVLSILPLVIGITSYLIYELTTPKPSFKNSETPLSHLNHLLEHPIIQLAHLSNMLEDLTTQLHETIL